MRARRGGQEGLSNGERLLGPPSSSGALAGPQRIQTGDLCPDELEHDLRPFDAAQNESFLDVLQEALIVLWERVRSGRFEYTAQLGTFVFATARNLWLRRLARMRRERPGIPDGIDVPDDRDSALDIMMESERSRLLERALHQLGEPCRELLMLFYWEELSLNDIAQRMGFANADTVKSKKYQCKKALRRLVDTID